MHSMLLGLLYALSLAVATERPFEALIPADAMAVDIGLPSPALFGSAPAGAAASQFAAWIVTFKAMGLIPRQGRFAADLAGTLPLVFQRPHAIILLDITSQELPLGSRPGEAPARGRATSAKPSPALAVPGIYRLGSLQAALLIDSRGIETELDRRIRDLLATYTDAENGRLESLQAGPIRYHRLTDGRLPPWAIVEWAFVGPHLLVTLGEGAFARMLAVLEPAAASGPTSRPVAPLAADPWFAQAHRRCHGATSRMEVYADIGRIRRRVGEVVQGRPTEVLRALGLEQAEQILWTVGVDGRAARSELLARMRTGPDRYTLLTGKELATPQVLAAIPPAANRYAVFRFPVAEAIRSTREAYLHSQGPQRRARWLQIWSNLEQQFHFDLEHGLLERLSDTIVFHTWPPHPLGISLLGTFWISYTGDRAPVAETIDGIMAAWQDALTPPNASRPSGLLSPRVNRDPDGIWYLQLGLVGPAVGVVDGWIVVSFSPEAVRANLGWLRRLPAAASAPSVAEPPADR